MATTAPNPPVDFVLANLAAKEMLLPLTGRQLFIVWCRVFFGMGVRETARYQGISHVTVLESMGGIKKKWRPYLDERRTPNGVTRLQQTQQDVPAL